MTLTEASPERAERGGRADWIEISEEASRQPTSIQVWDGDRLRGQLRLAGLEARFSAGFYTNQTSRDNTAGSSTQQPIFSVWTMDSDRFQCKSCAKTLPSVRANERCV